MGEYADLLNDSYDEESFITFRGPPRRQRYLLPDDPTKEWIAADGVIYKIADMTHAHLSNIILLLERKGKRTETSKLILIGHPSYPYLVREAIKRNLLENPHNGIDINQKVKETQQVKGKITTMLIQQNSRKVDFDL